MVDPKYHDLFWAKVKKTDLCWLWMGARNQKGYGLYSAPNTAAAHRVAYELLVGPIPEGLVLDHLCRNVRCVNPDHLEPVTIRENTARGLPPRAATHCKRGHELTPENTRWRSDRPTRECLTCRNVRRREERRRKKLAATPPVE